MKKFSLHLAALVITSAVALLPVATTAAVAGSPQQASLSLATGSSYTAGSTVSVTVSETSSVAVAGVEADFTYNTSQLQYVSTDTSTSAFNTSQPSSGGNGSVAIARTQQQAAYPTGQATVAVVNFKVLASTGTANLTISNNSEIDDSVNVNNVCDSSCNGGVIAASFQMTAAPSAPTSPSQPTQSGSSTATSSSKSSSNGSTTKTSGSSSVLGSSTTSTSTPSKTSTASKTPAKAVASSSKHKASSKSSNKHSWRNSAVTSSGIVLIVLVGAGLYWTLRRRTPVAVPVTYKAKATSAKSKKTTSTKHKKA